VAKQISQLIKAKQTEYDSKQIKPEQTSKDLSAAYMRIMFELFEALAKLLQGRSKGLEIGDAPHYTDTFKTWCRKLHDAQITKQEMRLGLKKLEEREEEKGRGGKDVYTPSYAEFIGMCRSSNVRPEHKPYIPLPAPTMSNEDKKERMKKLMGDMGL